MKHKQGDPSAKLSTVKFTARAAEDFPGLCRRISQTSGTERSDARTAQDKEFDLFLLLPRFVLNRAVSLMRWLDYHNLLPNRFIQDDPLYTSIFIANLGSLRMGPGFHHLFEWGNCPIFLMVGKIEARPTVVDGQVVAQDTVHLRWTFDDRIDDGLNARFAIESMTRILENPFDELGGINHRDGSNS